MMQLLGPVSIAHEVSTIGGYDTQCLPKDRCINEEICAIFFCGLYYLWKHICVGAFV